MQQSPVAPAKGHHTNNKKNEEKKKKIENVLCVGVIRVRGVAGIFPSEYSTVTCFFPYLYPCATSDLSDLLFRWTLLFKCLAHRSFLYREGVAHARSVDRLAPWSLPAGGATGHHFIHRRLHTSRRRTITMDAQTSYSMEIARAPCSQTKA